MKQQELRKQDFGKSIFPKQTLDWIAQENLWNLWVPKKYGGLEQSLSEGLAKLQELAKIDGSLGWTVTLCSGANYFIGNMNPETAKQIFIDSKNPVCFGGSGGVFGTAEKKGDYYEISGKWRYATGAPYLSHFTLNAEILENGEKMQNDDGTAKIVSFVMPKEEVSIIEDWDTMGLKASATCSFEVEKVSLHKSFSFIYNEFFQPQDIFKIPFSVFADLTLWVNYIGMAEHFLAEASHLRATEILSDLENNISSSNQRVTHFSKEIEEKIAKKAVISPEYMAELHRVATNSVQEFSKNIVEIFPHLGVNAARKNEPVQQIFCDYFTATQHHIFTK